MGMEAWVLVRVTWCHPPGQAGKGAANSEGGAQSGIKNSHHFSPEGHKEIVKARGQRRRRRRADAGKAVLVCSISGCGLFYRAELSAGIIADFQLCADMFPSSAHINDTLVSIVTKGERRGKGVLHWAKGIQPKAATRGGWEEGSVFPTTGLVDTVDFACPLASALGPCTFRRNGAQSKSLTRAHWDGGGTGLGDPLSRFRICPLVMATGARVAPYRGKGTSQTFCFYKWELSNSAFSRLLSSIPSPRRVQQGSQAR